MAEEWKPREREIVIDGLEWVGRMADKARAQHGGYIGEYIYPCPMDQQVLRDLGMSSEEFMQIAVDAGTDSELATKVKAASGRETVATPT